jgi:hypothetical protein
LAEEKVIVKEIRKEETELWEAEGAQNLTLVKRPAHSFVIRHH